MISFIKKGELMPALDFEKLEEIEVGTKEKRENPPEEGQKPVICVFDPIAVHAVIFDHVLAKLRDKADILWQAGFSRARIEMGGIGEKTYPGLIAMKKPVLLVSELEVVSGGGKYGLEMLGNIRRTSGLKDIPLIVISSLGCLSKTFVEKEEELKELKISQFFTWKSLEKEAEERKRLFDFVSRILGLKTKP